MVDLRPQFILRNLSARLNREYSYFELIIFFCKILVLYIKSPRFVSVLDSRLIRATVKFRKNYIIL